MSRKIWFDQVHTNRRPLGNDIDEARAVFEHSPLCGKTSDPEAAFLDEAYELFFSGIKLARQGDVEAGRAQIATAYLLDTRSINYVHLLPPHMTELEMLVMDAELLVKLSQAFDPNLDAVSYGSHVMRISSASNFGDAPMGQDMIARAMQSVNYLLARVSEDPKLEMPAEQGGVLGGCMTRPNLLFLRSNLRMAMGNHKKAINDLTKALEIDPQCIKARDARASLWASNMLKDDGTIVDEYKTIVAEAHPDNRGLNVAYAWLASKILANPALGTLREAKVYFENSLRATQRRAQLYGQVQPGSEPPVLRLVRDQYAMIMNYPNAKRTRELLDEAASERLVAQIENLNVQPDLTTAHVCLKCGKTAKDIGQPLSKCSRCKQVSYCSRKCQRADWREHKTYCKAIPKSKSQHFAFKPETNNLHL